MPDAPRRILIVRPSALGDVARTVPALVSLKRAYPDAEIDWLVNDSFVGAIESHPDLHAAVPFPRSRFREAGWLAGAEAVRYMRELRDRQYDLVVDLQGLARSGWLTWSTSAATRVGPADARELGWLAYTQRIAVDPQVTHTVDRMLAVVEGIGVPAVRDMRLYTSAADRAWATAFLVENKIKPGQFSLIAPTAKWLSKCWPVERFDTLIDRLAMPAVIAGAASDRPRTAALIRDGRLDLVGKTSVGRLMAMIEQAAIVIANDSAALHIAVGLGRRYVGIFGPTEPAAVGPYRYDLGVAAAEPSLRKNYRNLRDDQSIIASVTFDLVWKVTQHVLASPPPQVQF